MSKFGLLIGNGFTLDFIASQNIKIDSSEPLKNFNHLDINYNDFINYLPTIKNELLGQDLSDYKAIENYVSKYEVGSREECELRRFLAISYSVFQCVVDKYDLQHWKWVKWLSHNKRNLSCVISFNYDLMLERALMYAGIRYARIGTNEPYLGVPVLKPHGSLDFDMPQGFIGGMTGDKLREFIWKSLITSLNDYGHVQVLPKSKWLFPRTEADIIPPSVSNIQRHLRWVDAMFKVYETKSTNLEALIIIGLSYWDVDRPEIDSFLEKLSKTTKVYIMNPTPSVPLIEKIESLGLTWENFDFSELPW